MSSEWRIEVRGQPRPKGSWTATPRKGATHLFSTGERYYRAKDMVLTPASDRLLAQWVTALVWAAKAASPPPIPLDGPWYCACTFWFQPPLSRAGQPWAIGHKREDNGRTTATGDLDKLQRAVLDALTGIFWRDDRLVADSRQVKRYCNERPPGASILVRFLGDEQLAL